MRLETHLILEVTHNPSVLSVVDIDWRVETGVRKSFLKIFYFFTVAIGVPGEVKNCVSPFQHAELDFHHWK